MVALDRTGRIRLLNDEAQRPVWESARRPSATPRSGARHRTHRRCAGGRATGTDLLTVRAGGSLVATGCRRTTAAPWPPCATARSWTGSAGSWTSTRGLIDALRAQDHEHANRMHTLLDCWSSRCTTTRWSSSARSSATTGHVGTGHREIRDPLLAALLVGKATVAAERGVALWVTDGTRLPDG
ncbi:hypothetical protein GCM10023238_29480 [Streptomyces heliomycini]